MADDFFSKILASGISDALDGDGSGAGSAAPLNANVQKALFGESGAPDLRANVDRALAGGLDDDGPPSALGTAMAGSAKNLSKQVNDGFNRAVRGEASGGDEDMVDRLVDRANESARKTVQVGEKAAARGAGLLGRTISAVLRRARWVGEQTGKNIIKAGRRATRGGGQ